MINTFYSTTNNYYKPAWEFDQLKQQQKDRAKTQDIRKAKVPTFAQIGANMVLQKRNLMVLRNQLVAKKWAEKNQDDKNSNLDELCKLRLKYNRNAIRTRNFPVKSQEYKYPERGLCKQNNMLYKTNYQNYGLKQPSHFDMPTKYHPRDNAYTLEFIGGMYTYEGLNTAYSFSDVHKCQDGDL